MPFPPAPTFVEKWTLGWDRFCTEFAPIETEPEKVCHLARCLGPAKTLESCCNWTKGLIRALAAQSFSPLCPPLCPCWEQKFHTWKFCRPVPTSVLVLFFMPPAYMIA